MAWGRGDAEKAVRDSFKGGAANRDWNSRPNQQTARGRKLEKNVNLTKTDKQD